MNYLEIEFPHGDSIVIAERPITFTALVDRIDRADRIAWSVASEPGKQTFGVAFTHRWTQTGVDQVVASIDGLTCGIIVYVFKTQDGGGTIAELLNSATPPIVRTVESFPPLPARALRASA